MTWMSLPRETRKHLVKVFDIERTGISEVRDNEVITDGYTNQDLEAITREKMVKYTGSDESFSRLWEVTLSKVKYELNPPIPLGVIPPTIEVDVESFRNVVGSKGDGAVDNGTTYTTVGKVMSGDKDVTDQVLGPLKRKRGRPRKNAQ